MWNNIEKFTLLLMFGFMSLIIHEGACNVLEKVRNRRALISHNLRKISFGNFQDVKVDDDATEEFESGRFKREVEAPPPDLGQAILEKFNNDVKENINKMTADTISAMKSNIENVEKMMEMGRGLFEVIGEILKSLPPAQVQTLNPFDLFKKHNLNFPVFNPFLPQNAGQG